MAVAFNGVTKTMTVTGVSSIDVQKDLYSSWKHWVQLSDNAKYLQAMRPVGGDSIGGGQSSPAYFFLMNNWKVVVNGINVDFKLNLYCEEATNSTFFPFVTSGNGAVSYKVSDSPIITISSGSGLSPEQDATLTGISNNTGNIPADVWGTADAQKMIEDILGKAVISPDDLHVTIYNRSDNSVSHEFDISADKRIRTPI